MAKYQVGIIGGGQLGKLLLEKGTWEKPRPIAVYAPYRPLADPRIYPYDWHRGQLNDDEELLSFGRQCQVITYEIETVSISALKQLVTEGVVVRPDPSILEIIQSKSTQKQWLIDHQFPTASFLSYEQLEQLADWNNYPCVNKKDTGGYDGRGVKYVADISEVFPGPALVEEHLEICWEISAIVARNKDGQIRGLPLSAMVMNSRHQLDILECPPVFNDPFYDNDETIKRIAEQIAEELELVGVLAIEFIITENGDIFVNELSPRPHNSGHHHLICCDTNQYWLLTDILLDRKWLSPENKHIYWFSAINNRTYLVNILGKKSGPKPFFQWLDNPEANSFINSCSNLEVVWYGKDTSQPGRKLGHLMWTRPYEFKYYENIKNYYQILTAPVAVIMGSSSDLPTMKPALEILEHFEVPYELKVVSAHRTPAGMLAYAQSAQERGFQVIIAGAGGAAHLPGMVASATSLPVIGVPIKSTNSIQGVDSLLSICQMPSGIPVGTMAVNGAENAGLYAARILAQTKMGQKLQLAEKLIKHKHQLELKVHQQNLDIDRK